MSEREVKVKGWPRGWTQARTRSKLIIRSPKSVAKTWGFSVALRPEIKNGATVEWFRQHLQQSFLSTVRCYSENMQLLK